MIKWKTPGIPALPQTMLQYGLEKSAEWRWATSAPFKVKRY